MEFKYSDIVDPKTFETFGLCKDIPLRNHRDTAGEVNGALRCHKDWSKWICPVEGYRGTLGEPFSFIRVSIPETLPERLEVISYANEFAFLYDDTVVEDLEQKLGYEKRNHILSEFSEQKFSSQVKEGQTANESSKMEGAKLIQKQLLSEMMAIDKERAITTMKMWQNFIRIVSTRQRSEPFECLEEYLPYRISDAGELFWFGLVTFGMGLTIPEHEMELCKRLCWPSWAALALTNDLFSWPKEKKEAATMGARHVMNAIWVLIHENSISEDEAKQMCLNKIKEQVAQAVSTARETKHNHSLSVDLRRYIEAILYSISGNLVWSVYCPRYHPE